MSAPLISVLIPAYNTEKYLPQCLDSVIGQTYKNLEIIIVDDGSTDASGNICDAYAAADGRVRVIHQENAGIAVTRNCLLAAARGAYVAWVDSDDWIEPDMYEYLLAGAARTGADITICGRIEEWARFSRPMGYPQEKLLSGGEALVELIGDHLMQNNLWDKLFKREVIVGVGFPRGENYEDIAVLYKIFEAAGSVAILPECKYHYRQRGGSVIDVADYAVLIKKCRSMYSRYQDLGSRWPELERPLMAEYVGAVAELWSVLWPIRHTLGDTRRQELRLMARFAKEHQADALRYTSKGITVKLRMRLTPYVNHASFFACYLLEKVYRLKHSRHDKKLETGETR